MLPDRYELSGNIIYVFSNPGLMKSYKKSKLKCKLVCPNEETAADALMLLGKAYCPDKIANLVCGEWK